jgi:hypothetical protein
LAFTDFTVGDVTANDQFYVSSAGVVGPLLFSAAGFYVATIIDLPATLPDQNRGICGHVNAGSQGGWAITMAAGPLVVFGAYGSDGTLYATSASVSMGNTYVILGQVWVDSGTGDTTVALFVDGTQVDAITMAPGVTFAPVPEFANDSLFCLGKGQATSAVDPADTMLIVGVTGGTLPNNGIAAADVLAWSNAIRVNGVDITLFGAPVTNEDRYSAASLTPGNAPDPYTSLISATDIEFNLPAGTPIQVVRFTPSWAGG